MNRKRKLDRQKPENKKRECNISQRKKERKKQSNSMHTFKFALTENNAVFNAFFSICLKKWTGE